MRGTGALYTVRSGDTLQSIAAATFGDASLWYKMAEANGLSGGAALVAGQSLLISDTGPSGRNNASSFRPYDAASAIGDTQPGAPKPLGGNQKCGVLGQAILVAIAVAVTAVTAGAAAGGNRIICQHAWRWRDRRRDCGRSI